MTTKLKFKQLSKKTQKKRIRKIKNKTKKIKKINKTKIKNSKKYKLCLQSNIKKNLCKYKYGAFNSKKQALAISYKQTDLDFNH